MHLPSCHSCPPSVSRWTFSGSNEEEAACCSGRSSLRPPMRVKTFLPPSLPLSFPFPASLPSSSLICLFVYSSVGILIKIDGLHLLPLLRPPRLWQLCGCISEVAAANRSRSMQSGSEEAVCKTAAQLGGRGGGGRPGRQRHGARRRLGHRRRRRRAARFREIPK